MTSSSNTITTGTPPDETTGEDARLNELRDFLHAIDSSLVRQIRERVRWSRKVQTRKAELGLPRVDLNQERKIIQYYADAFGSDGARIALYLLELAKSDDVV